MAAWRLGFTANALAMAGWSLITAMPGVMNGFASTIFGRLRHVFSAYIQISFLHFVRLGGYAISQMPRSASLVVFVMAIACT